MEYDAHVCMGRERAGKIKMVSNSRTLIIEIKFINAKSAAIHTENCQLSLNCDFNQSLSWELGFGQNLGWELGCGENLG